EETLEGGAKLGEADLATNRVVQEFPCGEEVAPAKSYLTGVRIDAASGKAFITDSAKGAISVVDLVSGNSRRLLDDHKSTKPESGVKLVVDGKELLDQQKKSPPEIASDGIAL